MPGLDGVTIRKRLADATLYLCTDARSEQGDLAEFAESALSGGVDILQLRDKTIEAVAELRALDVLGAACARHGALLAVNDRADIARVIGADVLHLGQGDLPVRAARDIVGTEMAIGRSTHSQAQARVAASAEGVDYFCVGPCWPTPTKPGRRAPGMELVRSVAAQEAERPWFAIGGIDAERMGEVRSAGAARVVVVRAITQARDPASAARALRELL